MCLAIPMQVVALDGGSDETLDPQVALVESDGVRKAIRLEMADRLPTVGEYVIIHAGFAIRTLTAEEAEYNLELMRKMVDMLDPDGGPAGAVR
ncbi:MAG: HypC/HybG/HupF family hydrogenase formation chaperone [Desulfobulbus sp.]|uniref:HypC/HybG/HupF family hydrogenase formation chaperone n=1 Tax=Desulfobulbus sp. TaxID=895 RepID=UPI002840F6EE|nr:HypC/HybG/HupF family hydrogenase formation chaperone [Desulfobulbus sp.]MDR2549126.1 HypC/HybG/HupF family hydrogenase formation chaperone [Desulfobulbus sp.]